MKHTTIITAATTTTFSFVYRSTFLGSPKRLPNRSQLWLWSIVPCSLSGSESTYRPPVFIQLCLCAAKSIFPQLYWNLLSFFLRISFPDIPKLENYGYHSCGVLYTPVHSVKLNQQYRSNVKYLAADINSERAFSAHIFQCLILTELTKHEKY